eukprot:TRINITY_DN2057_c1_g1_i8.p1 TRINITY_DN2057_c1_g1~~TRINITY_DN2057_c1_g1_i8.p1  ORF type:complete len:540 (-),score=96.97 TRINITY_DN2057_c1_g1_i8:75-1694(-)
MRKSQRATKPTQRLIEDIIEGSGTIEKPVVTKKRAHQQSFPLDFINNTIQLTHIYPPNTPIDISNKTTKRKNKNSANNNDTRIITTHSPHSQPFETISYDVNPIIEQPRSRAYKTIVPIAYQLLKPRFKEMLEKSKECVSGKYGCSRCNGFVSPVSLTKIAGSLLTLGEVLRGNQIAMATDTTDKKNKKDKKDKKTKKKKKAELEKKSVFAEDLKMLMHCFGDVRVVNDKTADLLALVLQRYVTILCNEIEKLVVELNQFKSSSSSSSDRSLIPESGKGSRPRKRREKEEVGFELISLVLAPDLMKVEQMRRAITFLKENRRYRGSLNDGEFDDLDQEIEILREHGLGEEGEGEEEEEEEDYKEEYEEFIQEGEPSETRSSNEGAGERKEAKTDVNYSGFSHYVAFWRDLFGNYLDECIEKTAMERLERLHFRYNTARELGGDAAYFDQCTAISFHRPNRLRLISFLKNEINIDKYSFFLGNRGMDMLGIHMYNMVEEIIKGALKFQVGPKVAITPMDLAKYFVSVSQDCTKVPSIKGK